MSYEWTSDMQEISGFGGEYEVACRAMLKAALEYWDERGDTFDASYRGDHRKSLGPLHADNLDAVALDGAMAAAVPRWTAAQHHAVVIAVLWIRRFSWEAYCAVKRGQARPHVEKA